MCIQRDIERALKVLLEKCDVTFKASDVTFDAEASSSEEEGVASAAIAPTAAIPAEKAYELPMVTAPEHGAGPEPTLPDATAATTGTVRVICRCHWWLCCSHNHQHGRAHNYGGRPHHA